MFSCKKEEQGTLGSAEYFGVVSANQNEVDWESSEPYAYENFANGTGISLSFPVYDNFERLRETLTFSKIPFSPGTYRLEDANLQEDDGKVGSFFSFDDVDLVLAYYVVLESDSSSFITLESFDEETQEVRGTFDVTFIKRNHYDTTQEFPDTLRFRDGVFHTKLVF